MANDDTQREPSPEAADPGAPPATDAPADETDTEGHSLFMAELGRQMAGDRSREAAEWARGEKARREQKKDASKKR
jgi:hypothetical protein